MGDGILQGFPATLTAIALAVLTLLPAARAHAGTDTMLLGARECTRHFPRYERLQGIPEHLLSAISITESGRWHDGLAMKLPWPWTINAEGKGYVFKSRDEAIVAVRNLRRQGVRSIDIGCMQVNLLHHPYAFRSLEEAFDPEKNVAYASRFLRSNFDETNSWRTAVANYHSRTPTLGTRYTGLVRASWNALKSKLTNEPTPEALDRYQRYLNNQPLKPIARSRVEVSAAEDAVVDTQAQHLRLAKSSRPKARMTIINATDGAGKLPANSIRIIRPRAQETVQVASAAFDNDSKTLDIALRGREALKADSGPKLVKVGRVGDGGVNVKVSKP